MGKEGSYDTLAGCLGRGVLKSGPHTFPSRGQKGVGQVSQGGEGASQGDRWGNDKGLGILVLGRGFEFYLLKVPEKGLYPAVWETSTLIHEMLYAKDPG